MKILLLAPSPFFQLRGTPIAVRLLAQVLTGRGYDLHILTYHEGEAVDLPHCTLSRIPVLPGIKNIKPGPSWKKIVADIALFLKLVKLIRREHFDLVHAVEESAFMALMIKKWYKVPFVYDLDSSLSQQMAEKYPWLRLLIRVMEFFERKAVEGSLGAVTVCRDLEERVLRWAPSKLTVRLEDITLLPDSDGGDPAGERADEPVIMYMGNLERYQGIDLLLEAFQLAVSRISEARLVIIGGSASDIARYQKTVRELGIEGKTSFLGPKPLSEMRSHFNMARVLVSPRIQGRNTPMKIYSYLDSGKPLLATNLPTHTQVLDPEIAYLVPPTSEAMAKGIEVLLKDKNLGETLAYRAGERVRREYCFEAYQRKLLNFYAQIESKIAAHEGRTI
jgi:glycosyltransferase involved in cell wall biosynthesis